MVVTIARADSATHCLPALPNTDWRLLFQASTVHECILGSLAGSLLSAVRPLSVTPGPNFHPNHDCFRTSFLDYKNKQSMYSSLPSRMAYGVHEILPLAVSKKLVPRNTIDSLVGSILLGVSIL